MFDIAKRDERGLLVYDPEAARSFFTEKENALHDEYMEKFRALFDRRDSGEISSEECERLAEELDDEHTEAFSRLYDEEHGDKKNSELTYWSDVRDEFMTAQEQAECQDWLAELGKLMEARDAGKINVKEYCRLCFELDKKYGIADDEDAELYLAEDEDYNEEPNFNAPLAFIGG